MAHLVLDKLQRKQYLKAKRRLALNMAKPGDINTVMSLYKAPQRVHKNTGVMA